jgi:hypothetical protein
MCAKILEAAGKLNMDEYQFFLRGGVVLDRENQMDNPCSQWLLDVAWDNITELDKQTNFHGIITAFEQYPRDWNIWYTSAEPESAPLPGQCEISLPPRYQVSEIAPSLIQFPSSSLAHRYLVSVKSLLYGLSLPPPH